MSRSTNSGNMEIGEASESVEGRSTNSGNMECGEASESVERACSTVTEDGLDEQTSEQSLDQGQREGVSGNRGGRLTNRNRRVPTEEVDENYNALQARVEALRLENRELHRQLIDAAERCLRLKDENSALLEQLRTQYPPDVVASLAAENPNRGAEPSRRPPRGGRRGGRGGRGGGGGS